MAPERIPATRFESSPDFEIHFPPLPRTVAEVSKLLAEETEGQAVSRLVEIIRYDPIVAAFVLRRVNSAYYGLRRPIDDVHRAVVLLGFEEVCQVTLAAGMVQFKEVIASDEQVAIFKDIMKVSIGAAYFARALAAHLALPLQAKAFLVGLQHAIGRLVLLHNRPEDYEALWYTADQDFGPRASAEQAIFGIDHASLGGLAMDHWKLPADTASVIRSYLTSMQLEEQDQRTLALSLAVAVTASEQLCLDLREPAQGAKAGASFFTPPPALRLLAKMEERVPAALIKVIWSEKEKARAFIEAMLPE